MSVSPTCPDPHRLKEFLIGQLPVREIEVLAQHIEQCTFCTKTLGTLSTVDALVESMVATAEPGPDPPGEIVYDLIDKLESLFPESPAYCGISTLDTQVVSGFLAPPETDLEIGRLGNYSVTGVIGAGGMGVVLLAEDTALRRRVALKVIRPELAYRASARRRFLREAQAAASLTHDNVIDVYHVGEDRGVAFFAMPLLVGESLEARLKRDGRMPVAEVLHLGWEVASGLAAAHARGLLHRDIKPTNIWLETMPIERGGSGGDDLPELCPSSFRVKLLDFGLARIAEGEGDEADTNSPIGTPGYMAPEQVRGEPLDGRCDLFGLGCVLYRACTGRVPFPGANPLAALRALEMDKPEAPAQSNRDLPPALSDLILRLLEKKPENRFGTATQVRDTLGAIRDGRLSKLPRNDRRPRRQLITGLLALVLALVGATAFYASRPAPLPPPAPPDRPEKVPAGTFWPQVVYPVGKRPNAVVVGDFNGDGRPDLAVANTADSTIGVLLNDGSGAFRPAVNYTVGGEPAHIVVGDFNNDGKPDLAVAAGKSDAVALLFGRGDGTFQAAEPFRTGRGPTGLAAADLNGDGHLDLISTSFSGVVNVHFGRGDGTFGPAHVYAAGGATAAVAVADLNGDGRLDLIVSNGGTNSLSILLGAGDGTFRPEVLYGVGSGPGVVVVADFNRDGKADLAVENVGTNDVSVLLGNGDGTFGPVASYSAGAGPGGLVAADLDGDGLIDLATANHHSLDVTVLFGKGDGSFGPPIRHPARWVPAKLAVGDFDGDGRPDLAVTNHLSHDLSILRGRPPVPHFRLALNKQVTAGGLLTIGVTACDATGTIDRAYTALPGLAISDDRAVVGTDQARGGACTFQVRLSSAGVQTIAATDPGGGVRVGTATVLVLPAETAGFRLDAPPQAVAGKPFQVTATAVDSFGNPTTEFLGVVRVRGSDTRATLPPEYRFPDSDEGKHVFDLTLMTPGPQTLALTAADRPGLTETITITVGPVDKS
jgi:serine/threonine protein kinase